MDTNLWIFPDCASYPDGECPEVAAMLQEDGRKLFGKDGGDVPTADEIGGSLRAVAAPSLA